MTDQDKKGAKMVLECMKEWQNRTGTAQFTAHTWAELGKWACELLGRGVKP